jgi:hypothetical protein
MDWKKTAGKILWSALIAAGVMLTGAFLQGLQNFHPEPGTQAVLWQAGGAALIGLVTGIFNWLKHKDDEIKK